MKILGICAALLAVLATPAAAEVRYDRKLEEAVKIIVASKMGDLRGGFSHEDKPAFVVAQDQITTGSIAVEAPRVSKRQVLAEGLVPAAARSVSRIIPF